MFTKPVLMKCGHLADTIMTDVPYHDQKVDIAACSVCFNQLGTAIQPACNMAEKQPKSEDFEPLPKIKREYGTVLVGLSLVVATIVSVVVLLVSI